mmetsp:Transcript_6256/g.9702  ORF Transcript_6256/g.9702 Transcript_6256/m.9702 type:complete len:840 (+) Transcript_6256:96-2615(+)
MMNMTSKILLCALSSALLLLHGDVAAADNSGVDDTITAHGLKNLRARNLEEGISGPLNLFQQSTVEELAAPQQLRGHDDTPPSSPTPPLNLFKQTRIVNGVIVEGGNGGYPFQVQIGKDSKSLWCGASLIAPDVVLTAAHCGSPSVASIWDHSTNKTKLIFVERRVVHPNYSSNLLSNDIELLKLKEPAWDLVDDGNYNWTDHPPAIRLQRYQTPSGCTSLSQDQAKDITTMTVIGHGTTEFGGKKSDELLEADVHYVLNSVCQTQYKNEDITADMLCASDTEQEQDACQGDSGGPLFTRLPAGDYDLFTLVGTTSWGYGCAMKEYPGVYSRVAANTDWIDEQVCGGEGLSPKSCNADGKIRDFALESLTRGTNSRRRTQTQNAISGRTLADLDFGVDYAGATLQEEVCELLGGSVDEETLPPASSSPSISSSPSHAPIISPSMVPSVSPTLMPSTFPSGSPSRPPGISPTKKFSTKDKNANQKAKGIMYQMQAEEADVKIEKISFKTKDDKDTEVQVYFQLGAYESFPGGGMDSNDWEEPVFDDIPDRTSDGLREVVLDEVLTIPKGETASIQIVGKKEILYEEGDKEFATAYDTRDFKIFTGHSTKKSFEKKLKDADFVGEITYHTYTAKVTSTPSLSPSSSKLPTLPPNDDSTSPSMLPSNRPSSSPDDGNGGDDTPKEYDTPNVNDAGDNAKGIMFTITSKSKEVTITDLGIIGKDAKESDLWVYYQKGSYAAFDALNKNAWEEVLRKKVALVPGEIFNLKLDEDITIPAGEETVSVYVVSKKGVLYEKPSKNQFDIYAQNEDFEVRVGTTTKKEFQQFEKLAEFAGRFVYQTKG